MRKTLVAGNWKMNASTAQTSTLLQGIQAAGDLSCDVAVFPPHVYLTQALAETQHSTVAVGAQNCATETSGAYTGEVSADMLSDIGASMVLVGHSERRTLYGETDSIVLTKTQQALRAGLIAVVCVGETLAERKSGRAKATVAAQLQPLLSALSDADWQRIVIAYEPVWAIGTGETATPAQAQEIHAAIRDQIRARSARIADETRVLYGGSVKAANAAELFSQPDIDGGLVGGASLDVKEFIGICRA